MKYLKEIKKKLFYKEPIEFNKYSSKDILKYAVGANLYMNGEKDFYNKIINGELKELGTISICFEDITKDSEVELAENKVVNMINKLNYYNNNVKEKYKNSINIIEVRNIEDFYITVKCENSTEAIKFMI